MAQFRLIPRDERFFELFEQAADLAVAGAETLQKLLQDLDDVEQYRQTMADIEHAGDKVIHEAMEKLNRTFITPLDPEDIRAIANRLDDIVDSIHAAVERVVLCRIIYPNPGASDLTSILVQATREVKAVMVNIRDLSQRDLIAQRCIEINRLENAADQRYRETLGKLFVNGDLMELLRWKEIIEHIEHAANHCEALADIIEFTVVKHS
ncbi:MAG TPA: DUF47 family protein [Armatimonadota bacterium]|nr:DUF47 family protein [Armatimonadota bacterium]